jgi:hypothetical protein
MLEIILALAPLCSGSMRGSEIRKAVFPQPSFTGEERETGCAALFHVRMRTRRASGQTQHERRQLLGPRLTWRFPPANGKLQDGIMPGRAIRAEVR